MIHSRNVSKDEHHTRKGGYTKYFGSLYPIGLDLIEFMEEHDIFNRVVGCRWVHQHVRALESWVKKRIRYDTLRCDTKDIWTVAWNNLTCLLSIKNVEIYITIQSSQYMYTTLYMVSYLFRGFSINVHLIWYQKLRENKLLIS